jgi:hypothetical protein
MNNQADSSRFIVHRSSFCPEVTVPTRQIDQMSDDARIWIFPISPALDETKRARMLQQVDLFLRDWAAHNVPVTSAREILHGSFLVIAVDKESETSGCSIDRMFGLLRQIERDLGVAILDPKRVFVRHGDGRAGAMTREEFRASADPHTIVFDTLAERLGDVRGGRWERPAADSWHARLLERGFC